MLMWCCPYVLVHQLNRREGHPGPREGASDLVITAHENPGGQQEGEHRVVHHIQGEHYQRKELTLSHPQSGEEVQCPNSNFLGLSLSTRVWLKDFF